MKDFFKTEVTIEATQEYMTSYAVQNIQIPSGKKVWSKLKFTDDTIPFINCIIYLVMLALMK